MMPGISVSPPASTISDASSPTSPIAAMRPSLTATSARIGSCPSPSTNMAARISCFLTSSIEDVRFVLLLFDVGTIIVALHASIGLIRPKMDQPQSADLTLGSLQAKGTETEPTGQQGVG